MKLIDVVLRVNKSSNTNQLPKIEYEDIVAGEGRLNKDVLKKFDDRKGIEFEPSDILYGKLRPYLKNWLMPDFKGVALGDFWVFRAKEVNSIFIYDLIQANKYQKVANDTAGTKMPRSDWKKVSTTKFFITTNKTEQQRIGLFFKQLDNLITLQHRKIEFLKKLKSGYLQQVFPAKNKYIPQLRFSDFNGDWVQRQLGEVVNFLNGRAFKQQELLSLGKYRVLRVGNFNTNDKWYYSNLELEETKYANKNDLLYLWATNFGPEIWNEERIIYHYHIWKLQLKSNEIKKLYLYTWLLTDKEKIQKTTNGTTMVHVTKGSMELRKFKYPMNIDEQQKIGIFFKKIDNLLALQQSKLDSLKHLKRAYLQKLFI